MDARRPLIAGNWKMNGLIAHLSEIAAMEDLLGDVAAELVICPPVTLLAVAAKEARRIALGGQDCHEAVSGAHTGCISAAMLADLGARWVIVGHSERRADQGETDSLVAAKARAAIAAGLTPIVCVGETLAERDAGAAVSVVAGQLAGSLPKDAGAFVVAYEPVWAIGTGRTPSIADIAAMHGAIRAEIAAHHGVETAGAVRILYGGSVKPANAQEILACPDVDGALVGGASLKATDFAAVVRALPG